MKQYFTKDFAILYDPPGDGSCQFYAISDQMKRQTGITVSAEELRRKSVLYLMEHASKLKQFVSTNWEAYVSDMSKKTT